MEATQETVGTAGEKPSDRQYAKLAVTEMRAILTLVVNEAAAACTGTLLSQHGSQLRR